MTRRDPLTYRYPRTLDQAWPQDGPQELDLPHDQPWGWGRVWRVACVVIVVVNWAAFVGFWVVWAAQEFAQ
jgi:hypothetical protein